MMKKKNKEKRDLKNFMAYVKYQCGHGVSLDDVLKNLGYVRTEKVGSIPKEQEKSMKRKMNNFLFF